MLRSDRFFRLTAMPYHLLTRHRVWEEHCARMARELPSQASRVLDLGCGPANSTTYLGHGAIGADRAMPMLRLARKRWRNLVCLDAAELPLRSGSLDAVTFHSVLYLLPSRERTLREVVRVLRPGGRAVLLEPREGHVATLLGLARALPSPHWTLTAALWRTMSRAYGRFTPDSLWEALESAKLRVLRIEDALGGPGLLAVAEKP
ncbi:MAG TPA: class I SAM-dependent methyltransferase [Myxococcaceae bacterium]|nr:class I SAM-dependent methyltransferase [Myxococcaceae bacterium]